MAAESTQSSPPPLMANWMWIDMNGYFASVEQHLRAELRGRRVAVIPVESENTCVIAASYDAKRFGVKTGTRVSNARRLCPEIVLVKARPDVYVKVHHAILRSVDQCAPVHKVYSIDEWTIQLMGEERKPEKAVALGRCIQQQILRDFSPQLTCSVGIGFLHGSFVYTGTRCTMALRTRDNRVVCVEGKVVRCQLVQGHIHEIGIRFNEAIELSDFVVSALRVSSKAGASKKIPQLSGTVLYVEDSASDQELMAFHLANVGVKVKTVSDVLAAIELASQTKFDAVMANIWLPAMSGLELADFLRQNGYRGPIIALIADDRPEVQVDACDHGCTSVLVKPYNFEDLLAILEPHLRSPQARDAGKTLMSEMWSDERMQPLIRSFLNRLKGQILELQHQVDVGKPSLPLRKICLDVKGSAGGYGFPTISAAAQAVWDKLLDEAGGEPLKGALIDLANLCSSACGILEKEPAASSSNPGDNRAARKAG